MQSKLLTEGSICGKLFVLVSCCFFLDVEIFFIPFKLFVHQILFHDRQVPPNGQGIAGLIALKGIAKIEEAKLCEEFTEDTVSQSAGSFHAMIEMMRLGFADARKHVCDREFQDQQENEEASDSNKVGSNEWLLDDDRIGERATRLFNNEKAVIQGEPDPTSCTVSFQVVDSEGNAISFVNRYETAVRLH